jgi:hypothetical protein
MSDLSFICCSFYPDTGLLGLTINNQVFFHYDDPNLDPSFYGHTEALKERRRIAAMTPEQLEEYRRVDQENRFYTQPEFTEETKRLLLEIQDPKSVELKYK